MFYYLYRSFKTLRIDLNLEDKIPEFYIYLLSNSNFPNSSGIEKEIQLYQVVYLVFVAT